VPSLSVILFFWVEKWCNLPVCWYNIESQDQFAFSKMDVRLCLLCLCLSGVQSYEDVTIWEYINTAPDLVFLAELLRTTGLADVLTHTGSNLDL